MPPTPLPVPPWLGVPPCPVRHEGSRAERARAAGAEAEAGAAEHHLKPCGHGLAALVVVRVMPPATGLAVPAAAWDRGGGTSASGWFLLGMMLQALAAPRLCPKQQVAAGVWLVGVSGVCPLGIGVSQ